MSRDLGWDVPDLEKETLCKKVRNEEKRALAKGGFCRV